MTLFWAVAFILHRRAYSDRLKAEGEAEPQDTNQLTHFRRSEMTVFFYCWRFVLQNRPHTTYSDRFFYGRNILYFNLHNEIFTKICVTFIAQVFLELSPAQKNLLCFRLKYCPKMALKLFRRYFYHLKHKNANLGNIKRNNIVIPLFILIWFITLQ